MAQVSDFVSSHSLTEETTNPKKQQSTGTLTSPPPLPTLPFDLLPEILCRLPVKLLVQLRCLCKFFNSLISDPKFAKKHLQFSTMRHHLMLRSYNYFPRESVLLDSPIFSVFSTSSVVTQTQLYPPNTLTDGRNYVTVKCSCDGMFCGMLNDGSYFLWNPSIRTFKLLPPLEYLGQRVPYSISFGYDHFIDNYKVIVISFDNEVCINTLGTDYWRRIEDIPYYYGISGSGIFVSDTVNWLTEDDDDSSRYFILSFDLEKESYQELYLPYSKNDWFNLDVVSDCLRVLASSYMFLDVWIMKEYGNQESWIKLYSVPNMQGFKAFKVLSISEEDQVLVKFHEVGTSYIKLVVYDSKTGTLNFPEFQNNFGQMNPMVYIESLISP